MTAEGGYPLDEVSRTLPCHEHVLGIGPGCTALWRIVEHQASIAQDSH